MTSYLRYIFGGSHHQNSAPAQEQSKSHGRSRSAPTQVPNYIYGPPSCAGSAAPSSRLKSKRSNSYCARTTAPSPLRYATMNSAAAHQNADLGAHARFEPPPLYRRASYKSSEHGSQYPLPTPSASFGASSRTSSSSSLLPGMGQRPPSSSGSSNHLRYTELRPALRHNNTWQSSVSSATGSAHSCTVDPHHVRSAPLHMHPLFASTRLHNAPISYDVTYTPSSRTVLDRTTHTAVPAHTLSQPATDPPTASSSRIVLRSDKFPWPVVVSSGSGSGSSSNFYIGSSSPSKSSRSAITNLDLLYALHTTLLTRVTPQEWESLGHGSRAQRKVTRAYEKRCTKMGGGWEGGVRRVDWLHGKTRLIGIEVEKHGSAAGSGKLVFGKA
ncbi:hypothetical protein BV22DRAFT_1107532 [Leucogyrophana mollusca]|uniref:Uncharacterized protein n=1 Tax=Leucogyrophana mollusca TaxID=85980 RepID=A0ACB8B671_9AGAM|nr:hypothetical protein BV22DRAFT_1107532 [Leucogyrophana mollusca]